MESLDIEIEEQRKAREIMKSLNMKPRNFIEATQELAKAEKVRKSAFQRYADSQKIWEENKRIKESGDELYKNEVMARRGAEFAIYQEATLKIEELKEKLRKYKL